MRRIIYFAVAGLLMQALAHRSNAQGRPEFRPAVLGSGPTSLINRIDAKAVSETGLQEGSVMFCSHVLKDGTLTENHTYRVGPGSEKLEQEVLARLADTKVAPAIYMHQPVDVMFYATVLFSNADGVPRIRIFLNQDPSELKKGSDFICPQPVFGGDSKFGGLHYPRAAERVPVPGLVGARLKVDAQGNLQEFEVLNEEPPLLGFGPAAIEDFRGAKFIPAFRAGDPDACDTLLPVFYPLE